MTACPRCGAGLRTDARWCSLCHFRPRPEIAGALGAELAEALHDAPRHTRWSPPHRHVARAAPLVYTRRHATSTSFGRAGRWAFTGLIALPALVWWAQVGFWRRGGPLGWILVTLLLSAVWGPAAVMLWQLWGKSAIRWGRVPPGRRR